MTLSSVDSEGDTAVPIYGPPTNKTQLTPSDPQNLLPNSPPTFTPNAGQLPNDAIRLYDPSGDVWFTDDGIWLRIRDTTSPGGVILHQRFLGSNIVTPEGRETLPHYSNFFYGNDPEGWVTEVPNYAEVWYPDLYDGIDLRYYTNEDGLKYDLIVHPGAEVGDIRIIYEGAQEVRLVDTGSVIVETDAGSFEDGGLYIYQETSEGRVMVEGEFALLGEDGYGFEIMGDYDRDEVLVIDPGLKQCTFLGGSGNEMFFDIGMDSNEYVYLTGYVKSCLFDISWRKQW